ncbi:MAG: hypothetical protein HY883_06515, partial [Deltaproteobacteria bacterium]|nr:hypothetical protein [Deltaproteobacteria bacterium]
RASKKRDAKKTEMTAKEGLGFFSIKRGTPSGRELLVKGLPPVTALRNL